MRLICFFNLLNLNHLVKNRLDRYWRRKVGCLEWSLIRNHCLSFVHFNFACCQREAEREREREIGHDLRRKGGVWNEVWSKIITSYIYLLLQFPFPSWFTYLHTYIIIFITSCMGWDWSRTRLHSSHLTFLVEAINHNKKKVILFSPPIQIICVYLSDLNR